MERQEMQIDISQCGWMLQKIKMLYWWRRTLKKMIIHILLRLEWHHTLEKSLKILNLDPKNQYLIHFGLVRKYKGLDLLIESMTELIKTNKNLILLIVGEFYSNKEKYLKQITRLKLEKNIKIIYIRLCNINFSTNIFFIFRKYFFNVHGNIN